jgi:hypothetical protein
VLAAGQCRSSPERKVNSKEWKLLWTKTSPKALLAEALDADGLLMLSDLPVVDADYGTPGAANRSGHPRRNPQPKIPRGVDGL